MAWGATGWRAASGGGHRGRCRARATYPRLAGGRLRAGRSVPPVVAAPARPPPERAQVERLARGRVERRARDRVVHGLPGRRVDGQAGGRVEAGGAGRGGGACFRGRRGRRRGRDRAFRRLDPLGGAPRVRGRARLQVANLTRGRQHQPELGRLLLDALARGEPRPVQQEAGVLSLERRDPLRVRRDVAVHLQQVDVEEDDPREQEEDERDPAAPGQEGVERAARPRASAAGKRRLP